MIIIIIINVSWAGNQNIRMISEGLCDTEEYEAENVALITGIKYIWKYIQTVICYLK